MIHIIWCKSVCFKVLLLWHHITCSITAINIGVVPLQECIAETTFIPDVDYLQGSFSIQSEPEFLLRRFEFSSARSYLSESRIIFLQKILLDWTHIQVIFGLFHRVSGHIMVDFQRLRLYLPFSVCSIFISFTISATAWIIICSVLVSDLSAGLSSSVLSSF